MKNVKLVSLATKETIKIVMKTIRDQSFFPPERFETQAHFLLNKKEAGKDSRDVKDTPEPKGNFPV